MDPVENSEPGNASIIEEPSRQRLVALMVEFARVAGCTHIKARLPGLPAPAMLVGALENHRPDLTCRQPDKQGTRVILDAIPADQILAPQQNRWTLLASAASHYNAELHFAVPRWTSQGPGDSLLRKRLADLQIAFRKIWAV